MSALHNFYTAAELARAARVSKRTIHRRAVREGWPCQRQGNRIVYIPPRRLLAALLSGAKTMPTPAGPGLTLSVISESDSSLARRMALRLLSVAALSDAMRGGLGCELALARAASAFSGHCSPTSLRRWLSSYAREGICGLVEHKRGRVGRKRGKGRK